LQFMKMKDCIESVYLAAEISHDYVSRTKHELHVNIQLLIPCPVLLVRFELLI
jgi:hypothetical protein